MFPFARHRRHRASAWPSGTTWRCWRLYPRTLDRPVRSATLFTEPLRRRVLALSDGGRLSKEPRDVMSQFAELAEKEPGLPAVRSGDLRLTYGRAVSFSARYRRGP